jgi:phage tail-like protein
MKVSAFAVNADIVGRRLRIGWDFEPEDQETLADIPPVKLCRKLRDFSFPTLDPYLVYDSSDFPPAPIPGSLTVTDLTTWEVLRDGERTIFEPVSVAAVLGGRSVEILRRTLGTTYDSTGVPVRQHVEIVDVGRQIGDIQAKTVYYYQLFSLNLPSSGDDAQSYRGSAMVTDAYGLNRTLYESLPEIYRRHDVTMRPITPGTDSVPEQAPRSGQLRRFIDVFGIPLDSLRGTAEGLLGLHDVDGVDSRYLAQLGQWIGWDLSVDADIPLRRNEIKAANRLYRLVGTLPGLRALVTQYTGWFTQVAEFAQNLTLSNQPPRRNLFAITADAAGAGWHGVDDAAELLGFASANQSATGTGGVAAMLTGSIAEPFALRTGMELTLAVDGLLSATVRFGPDDFSDVSHATASEVAAAVRRALPEVNASASGGRLVIASETVGAQSQVIIQPATTSLVSLESAPLGRLSAVTDSQSRIRLFYEAWETPTQPEASLQPSAAQPVAQAGSYLLRRVHYKTFCDGAWRDSHSIVAQGVAMQGDPAALALPDDRLWTAWIDAPQTDTSRLRFAIGTSRLPLPARLLGQRREPFSLTDGAVLTLTGNWPGVDQYTVHAANFADLGRATAMEVVAAMNSQLTRAAAAPEKNGSIRLDTVAAGAQATIAVNLQQSTTARALGFDQRNATGTPGSWDEEIDWSTLLDAISIAPGRHADVAAVADPVGGVRLAWAIHHGGRWRITTAHWDDRTLVGTANALFLRSGAGPWASVSGLPSNDVRTVAVDSDGTAWIATASGPAVRHPDGTIATPAVALPSNDVRSLIFGPDGTVWFATAGGIAARASDGTVTSITTASGLPSNDVRALALHSDGTLWAATVAGAVARSPSAALRVFDTASGLPSSDVRAVAIAADGTVYIGTGAGLAISQASGGFTTFDNTNGLGSADVRAVALAPDGATWVATGGGVSVRSGERWTTMDTAAGLLSDDVRTLSVAADGTMWVGTAIGVNVIAGNGSVSKVDVVGGGAASPAVQSIHTGWSATLELANGGGGNREPTLVIDDNKRTWAVWSQRVGVGNPDESWTLRYRTFDPATFTWGVETPLTTPLVGGRSSDRTPNALRRPGALRVFFSSDRNGGFGLWSVDVTLADAISPLVSIPDDVSSDVSPTPVVIGSGLWLLYRSDRNVPLAQVGAAPLGQGVLRSARVPDNGAVRRYSGSVSVAPTDLARLRTRRLFGDMLNYTPNRPTGGPLADDELYTRGTVGLYVSRANKGSPLTEPEAARLRELVARFIPVNVRALVIVLAAADTEFVYPAGADIQESYRDDYPFTDVLGALTDSAAAAMPNITIIHSNLIDNVSADPADLTTLRRRTFFLPLH